MRRKKAEEYTMREILQWIGAGPKKDGIWELTEEQVQQFVSHSGIIHYTPGFRYTKWEISSNGFIRWEPCGRREFETHLQESSVSQEIRDDPQ